MAQFEVGKKYRMEKYVIYNEDTIYTCVKRNKKSVIMHDDFYNENHQYKINDDGGEYILVNVGIIKGEVRA